MKLTMQLGSRSYDIILKRGCLANLYQFANVANRKVFILTDFGVPEQYAQTVLAQCPNGMVYTCLLYTSPSPRDRSGSRMPSSA